ncbi:hypothetical protein ACFQ1E_12930 [Sphingomonas canadensis]|uniref:Uncharacterized protein n=1 Tax=Sphingomonas canadensis TaxID=1219257 RepID=A0ABW3H7U5_9SPHN|nr:hypothetical protein [Sphingomonas canadensis]MCW3837098.1 hypothetical protein [Sphingomonas canadensis]
MNLPAEIRRLEDAGADGAPPRELVVARGTLVIMAHGLLSLPPCQRGGLWIESAAGRISADEAEAMLRYWREGAPPPGQAA